MSFDDSAYGVVQRGTNASECRWFAGTNASQVAKLPTTWGNGEYWVEVCPRTQSVLYQFSNNSGAAVGTSAASATGASGTTAAGLLLVGTMNQLKVPQSCVYFAYMTESGTSDIYMGLRSDKGSR